MPYRNTILGVGLLVVVLVVVLVLWHSHSAAQAGEAWNSLGVPVFQPQFADDTGRTIGEMQKAIQSHPGTPAAEWAEVFTDENELTVGTNKILTDKKTGIGVSDSGPRRLYQGAGIGNLDHPRGPGTGDVRQGTGDGVFDPEQGSARRGRCGL